MPSDCVSRGAVLRLAYTPTEPFAEYGKVIAPEDVEKLPAFHGALEAAQLEIERLRLSLSASRDFTSRMECLTGRRRKERLEEALRFANTEIARLTAERDAAVASEKAYQTPMDVRQIQWTPSRCPRCEESFYPDYEACNDGYYRRPWGMERCPYCGQRLAWDSAE